MSKREDALRYHARGRPGKIEVIPTKPVATQIDLSLAYSPGVAEPCREIHRNPDLVDLFTARRNLVAVVTDGSAVLGLGNIGPRAAKPVMEGKGVLFKRFADIDVFDIELDVDTPEQLIAIVRAMEPTFGGINLEDIAAPQCFVIERALREQMNIPVFHDDQHGTAIISGAALMNAVELQGKQLDEIQVTCIGAGAAATSCMQMWCRLGVSQANITMVDIDGVLHDGRDDLDEFRRAFARPESDSRRTLSDALKGADVMIGLAAGGLVSKAMLKQMAQRPIVFALANPDPEISYEDAVDARPDAIVATGRSDYPNQVNNVLGFPAIFRGALDVGATGITNEMELAAAKALAALAREEVSDTVLRAYGKEQLSFGPKYVIPTPFDNRVLYWVAPAVAQAAIDGGVAKSPLDTDEYREQLYLKVSPTRRVMWNVTAAAKSDPKRIVFAESDDDNILRAAQAVTEAGIAFPILLGDPDTVRARAGELGLDAKSLDVVDPATSKHVDKYVDAYWAKRCRRGVTHHDAQKAIRRSRTNFGLMMLDQGDADGFVAGVSQDYPATVRPALQIIGVAPGVRRAAGMYMMVTKRDVKFLADATINIDPDAQTLAETALLAAQAVRDLGIEPRVAMLSFSNFGDAPHPQSRKVAEATRIAKQLDPSLMLDGEMQANIALDAKDRTPYSFSTLTGSANVLIFPNLDAGNAAYKLLSLTGGATAIGPMVLGMRKPVNVLQQGADVDSIVHMTALTVAHAGRLGTAKPT